MFFQTAFSSSFFVIALLCWHPCLCQAGSIFGWLFPSQQPPSSPSAPVVVLPKQAPTFPPSFTKPVWQASRPTTATAPKTKTRTKNDPSLHDSHPFVPHHMHLCMAIVQDPLRHVSVWHHARKVAHRNYPIPKNTVFTPKMWFAQHHNVRVFNITNTPMQYRVNWKGGSSNVVANLEDIQENTGGYLPAYRAVHSNTDTQSKIISKSFGFKSLHDIKSFTFVREPFGHFLAGLREYYFRVYGSDFLLSPEQLEQDLYDMLDMNMTYAPSTLHSVMHVFPQSGILSFNANPTFVRYPNNLPTFIGKLERFDEDWEKVNALYHLNVTLNKAVAGHPTQEDPNRVKDAYRNITESNVPLRDALCVLLRIDYLCFEYEIPAYCKGVVKSASILFGKSS